MQNYKEKLNEAENIIARAERLCGGFARLNDLSDRKVIEAAETAMCIMYENLEMARKLIADIPKEAFDSKKPFHSSLDAEFGEEFIGDVAQTVKSAKWQIRDKASYVDMKLERANALFGELMAGYFAPAEYSLNSSDEEAWMQTLHFIKDFPHLMKLVNIIFDITLESERMLKELSAEI